MQRLKLGTTNLKPKRPTLLAPGDDLDNFNDSALGNPVKCWLAAARVNRYGLAALHGRYVHWVKLAPQCQPADGHKGTAKDDQAYYCRHQQFEQEKQGHDAHERGNEIRETSHDLDFIK